MGARIPASAGARTDGEPRLSPSLVHATDQFELFLPASQPRVTERERRREKEREGERVPCAGVERKTEKGKRETEFSLVGVSPGLPTRPRVRARARTGPSIRKKRLGQRRFRESSESTRMTSVVISLLEDSDGKQCERTTVAVVNLPRDER